MRIIAGFLGGRRLKTPPGSATRPTADRVREAIFNILGPPRPETWVLDAFAGAGGLGLEALSRGAARVHFIDSSRPALRCVHDNVRALGVTDACHIHAGDALALLRRWAHGAEKAGPAGAAEPGGRFGWIFLDPPYRSDLAARALEILDQGSLLARDAVVVVEHDRRNAPAQSYGSLVRTDHRRYGDTEVSFYRAQVPAEHRATSTKIHTTSAPEHAGQEHESDTATTITPMSQPKTIAVYPGTFDPITNGHIDILERSLCIFERVIVAIATNPRKAPLFSVEERIAFMAEVMGDRGDKLGFDSFHGLLVDYCRRRGATCIVRGLRALADFEYEFQFAHMNRRLAPGVDTVFFMTDERNHYVSSSLVKEVASFGGDVTGLVPNAVARALEAKFGHNSGDTRS